MYKHENTYIHIAALASRFVCGATHRCVGAPFVVVYPECSTWSQGRNQGPPNPLSVGEPTPLELTTKVPPPLPPPHPAAGVQADPISTAKKEAADSKTHHVQSTFGSWDVQKVHAVVARSTCRSQNVQSTPCSEHFGSSDVEKVHAVVARSTFWSQNAQSTSFSQPFLKSGCGFVWQAQGCCTLPKVSQTWGFCGISKNDGRCGTFEGDLQRCISRGRRSTRDMFIRDVRRSGSWFHEKGCILEHRIFRFAEMILRDRCSTSYNLASFFRGKHSTLDRRSAKIAKRIGTRPSALHSTFHFWRTSPRIALFLMLSTSKLEEVSLADLFRFWRCQVRKLRKSCRIASFSSLQLDRRNEREREREGERERERQREMDR